MAKAELMFDNLGGGDLSGTFTDFSAQASVSITCNIGDIVAVAMSRSAQNAVSWNGDLAHQSDDVIGYKSLATNIYVYYFKASQASNTFSIASGTITGQYAVITNS